MTKSEKIAALKQLYGELAFEEGKHDQAEAVKWAVQMAGKGKAPSGSPKTNGSGLPGVSLDDDELANRRNIVLTLLRNTTADLVSAAFIQRRVRDHQGWTYHLGIVERLLSELVEEGRVASQWDGRRNLYRATGGPGIAAALAQGQERREVAGGDTERQKLAPTCSP